MAVYKLTESNLMNIIKEATVKTLASLNEGFQARNPYEDCMGDYEKYCERKKAERAEDEKRAAKKAEDDKKKPYNKGVTVHFNESQLTEMITNAVKKVLNEMDEINRTGRDYATVKAVYDKMNDLGQRDRAFALKQNFNDLSDDPKSNIVARYPFSANDRVEFHPRDGKLSPNQYASSTPTMTFNGDQDNFDKTVRSDSPKDINDMLKHMKNVRPDSTWNKNNLRA